MPWLKYELPHLETALLSLRPAERLKLKPVMIVGAGLSAADAVSMCRSSGIPVIHVFRSRTIGLDKQLPENVYPEYHEVHKMMKDPNRNYDLYSPLPEHTIVDLYPIPMNHGSHKVTLQHLKTGDKREIEVSYCAILIGSRPDLRFLNGIESLVDSDNDYHHDTSREIISLHDLALRTLITKKLLWFKNFCIKCRTTGLCEKNLKKNLKACRKICAESLDFKTEVNNNKLIPHHQEIVETKRRVRSFGLGEDPTKPVDCKNNTIAVDRYTYEVMKVQRNLYAMGPLAGDNFVRFIPGGALAITADLHRKMQEEKMDVGSIIEK